MRSYLLILFMFISVECFSQLPDLYSIETGLGFVYPHVEDLRYLVRDDVSEVKLTFGYQMSGEKLWHQLWGYPELGFGFYHSNLCNRDIFGTSTAVFLYFERRLFNYNHFSISHYVGLGTAYLTKPFDAETNYLNIAIGSYFNIYANVKLRILYDLNRFVFFSDLGITHYSNGGTKSPNLGLNIFAFSGGLKFRLFEKTHKNISVPVFVRSWDLQILQSVSVHASRLASSDPPRVVTSFTADFGYYSGFKSRWGLGMDFFYDENIMYLLPEDQRKIDYFSGGIHFSYSAVFNKVQFTFQQIFILFGKHPLFKYWQRYGFRVSLGRYVLFGATLSTHFFNAMFIEPGIGLRF